MFNIPAFMDSLGIMVEGWLGIFIVMGIIIAVVYGLNVFSEKLEEKIANK